MKSPEREILRWVKKPQLFIAEEGHVILYDMNKPGGVNNNRVLLFCGYSKQGGAFLCGASYIKKGEDDVLCYPLMER